MDNGNRPQRNADVLIQTMGDESALYSSDSGEVHFLNMAAKLVWELCDGEHSIQDMETVFRRTFSIDAGHDVVADIRLTLSDFANKNLVVEVQ